MLRKEDVGGAEASARAIFAERLGVLMAERGLDPLGVWEITRVSPSSIHRYLAGQSSPRVAHLRRLVEGFGVSADYLIGAIDEPLGLNRG